MFKFVKRQLEVVSKIYASPSAVAQSLIFCRPEASAEGSPPLGTPSRTM
jgi:hypothetical protein